VQGSILSGHPIRTSSSVRARTVRAGGHDAKVLRAATSQDILELRRRKCNKCEIVKGFAPWLIGPSCPKIYRRRSGGLTVIEVEEPAEPFPTANLSNAVRRRRRHNQLVVEPLMVPLLMVVRHVFGDCSSKMGFTRRNQSFKALASSRKHKSLRESVQVRTVCGQPHCLDTSLVEDSSECLRLQWIPVEQQIPIA